MCLILFARNAHPDYELVIAANRDEFYDRPTMPAHIWQSPAWMIAGKDLKGGGTWLAADPSGRIAMLTNYRDPGRIFEAAPSRGDLIRNFFTSGRNAAGYAGLVAGNSNHYNGFNLICSDHSGMYYLSNYGDGIKKIDDGIHGLSNALLNDPWPKVERGKKRLARLLDSNFTIDDLLDLMYDSEYAPESELPDTGVGREWEKILSPMFIKSEAYGSRTTTVLLLDRLGKMTFTERSYDVETYDSFQRGFTFRTKHP